ncbi:MAG: DUF371 domain-containing protein [archaeon]|jgi:hypothetical protein|nr:hypothetical protein [Euryarchaeota archaeon]MDP6703969.1 DUF371 domain-containing protein [archaeon]MDP7260793.1 DUF371 domain-containing protein [archaeon]|tara:strand:+ start:5086 stop:5493 length:408 start_codon:yes stop_codon:yes gene_type:complete
MEIIASGHTNVLGTHPTTIEITKEAELTPRGNCIIAVRADKACSDLPDEIKKELLGGEKFKVTLQAGELIEEIIGEGSPDLFFIHRKDIVLRKSEFIDDRTLLVNCDKACSDLNREFIEELKKPETKLYFTLEKL